MGWWRGEGGAKPGRHCWRHCAHRIAHGQQAWETTLQRSGADKGPSRSRQQAGRTLERANVRIHRLPVVGR